MRFVGGDMPEPGSHFSLGEDCKCIQISSAGNNFSATELFVFIVEDMRSLGVGVLGSYLYDKMKTLKGAELWIEDEYVEISEEEIEKAIGNPKSSNESGDRIREDT